MDKRIVEEGVFSRYRGYWRGLKAFTARCGRIIPLHSLPVAKIESYLASTDKAHNISDWRLIDPSVPSHSQEPDDLLLIDDHPGEIRLIEEVVETADIETTLYIASDEEEARNLIHQRSEYDDDFRPDTVLLDWNLEKGTGREVLAEIKDTMPHTTVAIMTSARHQKEKIQSEGPQADMYLTKPDSPEDYIDLIYELPVEE